MQKSKTYSNHLQSFTSYNKNLQSKKNKSCITATTNNLYCNADLALLSSEPVKVLPYEAPDQVSADGVLRDVDDHVRGVLFTHHASVQCHLKISRRNKTPNKTTS